MTSISDVLFVLFIPPPAATELVLEDYRHIPVSRRTLGIRKHRLSDRVDRLIYVHKLVIIGNIPAFACVRSVFLARGDVRDVN